MSAQPSPEDPPGLRLGSVGFVMTLAVILGAAGIAGFLVATDPSSDLAKLVVGGWLTALGSVIGLYFGARIAQ